MRCPIRFVPHLQRLDAESLAEAIRNSSVITTRLHGMSPAQRVRVGQIAAGARYAAGLDQRGELEVDRVHVGRASREMTKAPICVAARERPISGVVDGCDAAPGAPAPGNGQHDRADRIPRTSPQTSVAPGECATNRPTRAAATTAAGAASDRAGGNCSSFPQKRSPSDIHRVADPRGGCRL